MQWTKLSVFTTNEAVEAITNILETLGANGVEIEDAEDLKNMKPNDYGEIIDLDSFSHIKDGALISVYLPETTDIKQFKQQLEAKILDLPKFGLDIGKNLITTKKIDDEDWSTAWKKYYHTERITRYLTVVPEWEDYIPTDQDEKVIRLDPGMAFGTGTHPTTRLSLEALETVIRGGEQVLDVGTGSGVLSIGAKLMGAKKVFAYDLDPVAVKSAQDNFKLNHMDQEIPVTENDLLTGVTHKANLILANILADIIVRLLPQASNLLLPGGKLILAGIINDKRQLVLDGLKQQNFILEQEFVSGEWHTMIVRPQTEED